MKIIFTFLIAFTFSILNAQVVGINNFPANFDKLVYSNCNNNGSLTPIDSGSNAYWDLSGFGALSDSTTHEYLPISNAKKALYPDANIMIKRTSYNYTDYDIYRKNNVNKTLELIAKESPSPPSSQIYNDYCITEKFNLTLGYSNVKNVTYKKYSPFGNTSGTCNYKYTVPGFGRIKLPGNKIYDSVYLNLQEFISTDSAQNPSKSYILKWYSFKYKGPIAIGYLNYNYMGGSYFQLPSILIFQKKPIAAPQTNSLTYINTPKCNVFPNPFIDEIKLTSPINEIKEIQIYNSNGCKIKDYKNVNSALEFTIDTQEFSNGFYFIVLKLNNNTTQSIKVSKS